MQQPEPKPTDPAEIEARRAVLRARIHATIPFGRGHPKTGAAPGKR